jgi:3-methyladenine DNA glycosylase AlkD
MNSLHREILDLIEISSGKPTKHTFSDSYLGNTNPRYAISNPVLRKLSRNWMKEYHDLPQKDFVAVLDSLVKGKSSTEKMMSGILTDYCTKEQLAFPPALFDDWLDHLSGWVEVDTVCTSRYSKLMIHPNFKTWKSLLPKMSRSKNINKRRASLVFLCAPVRYHKNEEMAAVAFANIERLKGEKEILITKAISWLLRSMVKLYKKEVKTYVMENQDSLPKIAVRETLNKLTTGKK